jgi:hypothetical protein
MTTDGGWLIDQRTALTDSQLDLLERELADSGPDPRSPSRGTAMLAVLIHDVVIHNNRKWFGEADVRLDALVITGQGAADDETSSYVPRTESFARVKDADTLQIGPGGLLAFHGEARHFLDILILVSRDTKDSSDLATILAGAAQSGELIGGVGALLGVAAATPQLAAATTVLGAAGALGDLAYRLLSRATGNTIGVFRNSHLNLRGEFETTSHHPGPPPQTFRVNDLSFRYEIVLEPAV